MTTPLVLDASFTAALLFDDETIPDEATFGEHMAGSGLVAPSLWIMEVANALVIGLTRGRLNTESFHQRLALLAELPVTMEPPPNARSIGSIAELALLHNLTVYDAAYLELALRRGLTLATLDRRLTMAARSAGVDIIGSPV